MNSNYKSPDEEGEGILDPDKEEKPPIPPNNDN